MIDLCVTLGIESADLFDTLIASRSEYFDEGRVVGT